MASIVADSRIIAVDDNNDPISGAKIYFFDAGTTTPRTVYTDAALSTAHAVPVVADSAGRSPLIFIDPTGGNYKMRVDDASDVLVFEDDDISPGLNTPVSVANGGTGSTTSAAARTALSVPSTSTTDAYNTRITALETTDSAGTIWAYDAQTFAASFAPDITSVNAVTTTLTANINVVAPTGGTDGKPFYLKLVQDATGGRTVTLDSVFTPQSGSIDLNWSTGPSEVDILTCQYISDTEIHILGLVAESATASQDFTDTNMGALSDGPVFTHAHGLSGKPRSFRVLLRCTTAESDFVIDEDVEVFTFLDTTGSLANKSSVRLSVTSTNAKAVLSDIELGTDAETGKVLTETSWDVIFRISKRVIGT